MQLSLRELESLIVASGSIRRAANAAGLATNQIVANPIFRVPGSHWQDFITVDSRYEKIPASPQICEDQEGHCSPAWSGHRERLDAVIGSGNSPQKHVWRARIVLLSGAGLGTMAIPRQTGKGKPTIWRWQARFMAKGVEKIRRGKQVLESLH